MARRSVKNWIRVTVCGRFDGTHGNSHQGFLRQTMRQHIPVASSIARWRCSLAGDPFVGRVHLPYFAETSIWGAGSGHLDCRKIGLMASAFGRSILIRSSFDPVFPAVTLGERIDSASSILATEEGEMAGCSRSSRSSA